MTEPNSSDHVPWWRRLPKVFITRSILLCIGVVAVFCLAIALAHFDLNLNAVRGQNNNYSQGDVFGELAVAAVCPSHLLFPLPSQSRSLTLGLSNTGIPLGRNVRSLLLPIHRRASPTSWLLRCRRSAVLSDPHGLPHYWFHTKRVHNIQQLR